MLLWSYRTVLALIVLTIIVGTCLVTCMPGRSFRDPLPPLTADEVSVRDGLRRDVTKLATDIGERCIYNAKSLHAAADYVEAEFRAAGYAVERQEFVVLRIPTCNLIVELPGTVAPEQILVVGAHYDSIPDCPAANDNGSAVASLLALARRFAAQRAAGHPCGRTLRFVAFTNEEPPWFQTKDMGSLVYAKRCRERNENIVGMISLECMGYYSDQKGSQDYPFPFSLLYPSRGNFVAFVGDLAHRSFVRQAIAAFRRHAQFPSEGAALPPFIGQAGWSDHWAFWDQGYPGLMITDTAIFRYPHYHQATDTPDKLDYDRLARVVTGVEGMVREMANQVKR